MADLGRVRIMLALAIIAVVAMSEGSACAQPNPYRAVENWVKLPQGRQLGEVDGVSVDRNGNIWSIERCGSWNCFGSNLAPILKFDPSGKLLKSFGEGMFVFPHGLYVDKEENVWATDAQGAWLTGAEVTPARRATGKDARMWATDAQGKDAQGKAGKGHQVFKFSREGKVLMVLGKAGIAGTGKDTFNAPSAVVVAPNGDIFVADGHGEDTNARIVKFSKEGKFIKAWGKKGSAPGEFNELHAIAMDSKGQLFVGDRGNSRIQIFDKDGNFLKEWKQFGRPSGIFIDANDTIYVADNTSNAERNPGFEKGIRIGSTKDGLVKLLIPALGSDTKPLTVTEGVAADAMGNLYGAESATMNLRKYVKN